MENSNLKDLRKDGVKGKGNGRVMARKMVARRWLCTRERVAEQFGIHAEETCRYT